MRIFFAGASVVIGSRLMPLLVDAGHTVGAMTRSAEKTGRRAAMGTQPIVCDVLRYGLLYGPGTYFEEELPPPRVHIDTAAARTLEALDAPTGILTVVDD
jgi:nucleoside-diphosphate-sugar epimerase